jgi:D-lactate dehydrogenase (cytochrome)
MAISEADARALSGIVGAANCSARAPDREQHARDASHHAAHTPDLVVWPNNAEEVARILAYANAHGLPVTPWGTGTGLEGGAIPQHGGISLSLARMDAILAVHADDLQVTAQPGLPHQDLNRQLARYGLFFPPDPGANASIGGMLATNAAGIRTVRYGATKDNVLAIQVALADGRLLRLGSRSLKQSSGYNLLQLFVGSEGTLGVITEATLKLAPIPQHTGTAMASFAAVEAAVAAVLDLRLSGLDLAALEYLDSTNTRILADAGVHIAPLPTLLLELHGGAAEAVAGGMNALRAICEAHGATAFRAATDNMERTLLWKTRHSAYEAIVRNHPGQEIVIMDVAVPISAYPELIRSAQDTLDELNLVGYMKGHAGDGNIHIELPYGDETTFVRIAMANQRIAAIAVGLGGTATGEHGVGIGKRDLMRMEHGPALDLMQAMKTLLDPIGILNPGKVLPATH